MANIKINTQMGFSAYRAMQSLISKTNKKFPEDTISEIIQKILKEEEKSCVQVQINQTPRSKMDHTPRLNMDHTPRSKMDHTLMLNRLLIQNKENDLLNNDDSIANNNSVGCISGLAARNIQNSFDISQGEKAKRPPMAAHEPSILQPQDMVKAEFAKLNQNSKSIAVTEKKVNESSTNLSFVSSFFSVIKTTFKSLKSIDIYSYFNKSSNNKSSNSEQLSAATQHLIQYFKENANLESEGIFRLAGRKSTIDVIVSKLMKSPSYDFKREKKLETDDMANALKQMLGKMGLFRLDEIIAMGDELARINGKADEEGDEETKEKAIVETTVQSLREFIGKLPNHQKEVLKEVMNILGEVVENTATTKMKADNIAIVVSPRLYKASQDPNDTLVALQKSASVNRVAENLIIHRKMIFS